MAAMAWLYWGVCVFVLNLLLPVRLHAMLNQMHLSSTRVHSVSGSSSCSLNSSCACLPFTPMM